MFDPHKHKDPISAATIALGVCIGILSAHIIEAGAAAAWMRIEIAEANEAITRQAKQAEQRAQRQADEASIAYQAQRQAVAQQQRQQAAEKQAQIDAATKKEQAWQSFYHRPPECDNNPDTATFTRCANEHIKAKTIFDAAYKP